jgi:hypothetical protein
MKRLLLLLPLAFLLAGCGRSYRLVGTVLFIEGAPVSSITEIVGASLPRIGGVPVGNATVTLFHELKDSIPVRNSVWHTSRKLDASGHFEVTDYGPAGKESLVGLEISALGYETAFAVYTDHTEPDAQYFLVVLRKLDEQSADQLISP